MRDPMEPDTPFHPYNNPETYIHRPRVYPETSSRHNKTISAHPFYYRNYRRDAREFVTKKDHTNLRGRHRA